MKIKGFNEFVNEENESGQEEFKTHREVLDNLKELGLVSDDEYKKDLRILTRQFGVTDAIQALPPDAKTALDSPEAKRLLDAGLTFVSSRTQAMRGNIILGFPGYDRNSDYALGLFPDLRKLRRMTPKKQKRPFSGWEFSPQDDTIKHFSKEIPVLAFYRLAMRWAADHLDLSQTGTFAAIKRTKKDYFDNLLD